MRHADIIEVGTPYLHKAHMAPDLALLPGYGAQLERGPGCRQAARPLPKPTPRSDRLRLGLANPLEAEGLTTKWAIELAFTPIQGYEQAGDLAELFARPIRRRDLLGGGGLCS
jgi:light-independent protochlorophyllide reductase subunit N